MVDAHVSPQVAWWRLARRCALLLALGATGGCMSVSSVQTARTLPVGRIQVQGGAGALTVANAAQALDQNGNEVPGAIDVTEAPVPEIELGARVGVAQAVDVGVKLSLPSSIMGDLKLQLVDTPTYAVALGFAAGYQSFALFDAKVSVVDLVVPLYVSYDVSKWVALYASPKYFLRISSPSDASTGVSSGASDTFHMVGATGGVRLGADFGLFFEATRLYVLNQAPERAGLRAIGQIHVAFFANFGGAPAVSPGVPAQAGPPPASRAAAPSPAPQPAPLPAPLPAPQSTPPPTAAPPAAAPTPQPAP